jgi:WD40 repeat protein
MVAARLFILFLSLRNGSIMDSPHALVYMRNSPVMDTFMTSRRRARPARAIAGLALGCVAFFAISSFAADSGLVDASFTVTGSMDTAREAHTATLLPSGKVLVVGGTHAGDFLASAELYDPGTGTWTGTGSLGTARAFHTATLLPSGKVLVTGGDTDGIARLASTELYDPGTGAWTAAGNLGVARDFHTATLLPSGKVLVAGGSDDIFSPGIVSSELYDPGTGTWTATGNLGARREYHTATLLPSGEVLVAGGYFTSAELYDPGTGSWTASGRLGAIFSQTATLLASGKVLVAGGEVFIFNQDTFKVLGSSELYDPGTATWAATGPLGAARLSHTATLLPSGKVLVVGGYYYDDLISIPGLTNSELYDPETGTWTVTGSLGTARFAHTATLLPSGKVLVAGGSDSFDNSHFLLTRDLASSELYDSEVGQPPSRPSITVVTAPVSAVVNPR